MKKLIELIKKNFKLLIRSKFSALIILIGPILIMLLAGLAFSNTNQYSIQISTFSEDYNELTNSYIDNLEANSYSLFKSETEDSCINSVKEGKFHVCIIFPQDFAVGKENQNQVNFYVDYSKINLVYTVIDTVTSQISESSSAISMNLTTNILNQIATTEAALKGKEELIDNLIEKNAEIDTSLDEMKTNLNTLDLSYDENNFKITSLSSYSSQLRSSVADIYDETDDFISEVSVLLEDIEDELNDLNSSSEKSNILDILEDINESMTTLENSTSQIYNESKNHSSSLISLINEIEDGLDDVESQLQSASTTRSSLISKIATAKEKISASRVSLLDLQSTINTINQGMSSVSLRDAGDIVNPTDIQINPVISEKTHLNYFFPALLTLVIMFISILLASNLVMMEKTSSAHNRNHVTPTKNINFLLSNYFTCLLIMALQVIILLIIGISLFDVSIDLFSSQFFILAILALVVSTVFAFFGMAIGYLFKSRETSTLGAISFTTIFFILSDLIVPIESIPQNLLFLTNFNPFMISTHLFRQVILFSKDFTTLGSNMYLILIYLVFFFALTLISLIRFNKNYFKNKLSKKEHRFFGKLGKSKL